MPVIGFLSTGAPGVVVPRLRAAFREGLKESGYVEGQNVAIETRFAEGQLDRMPALAADLVRLQVDVIVATTYAGVLAAKQASTTTPIVFSIGADPVQLGLVGDRVKLAVAHAQGRLWHSRLVVWTTAVRNQ